MQTFLPYASFTKTAKVLDDKRLNKQIVEAGQILKTNSGLSSGWQYHPITKMWKGYNEALAFYTFCCLQEWYNRGFKRHKTHDFVDTFNKDFHAMPNWIGYEPLHKSHRANLLRKDFSHYSQYFDEPDTLPYIWVHENKVYEKSLKNEPIGEL